MEKICSWILVAILSMLVIMLILYYPLIYYCQQDFSSISKNVIDVSNELKEIIKDEKTKE
jgi:hypothetical protein